jgi:hypothetical protein
VQLLMTLVVPADDVVFGMFAASSAQTVSEACRRAGCARRATQSGRRRTNRQLIVGKHLMR